MLFYDHLFMGKVGTKDVELMLIRVFHCGEGRTVFFAGTVTK